MMTPLNKALFASLAMLGTSQASLVLHWTLDESTGNTAADSSGNGIDGAWQGTAGTPAWSPAGGVAGGAFSFTGANADSFIVATTEVSATPFTISLWMNTTSTQNDGLAYLGNGGTGNQYNVVRMQANVARANARNTAEIQLAGTTTVNDGAWHHVVAVYGADDNRQIYIDGVLEGTNTTSVNSMVLDRFGIGALTRNTPYNPADLYTGLLDDVQLYSRGLTQAEVTFLQANPGTAITIPEPSSIAMLLLGGAGLIRRRRA